MPLVDYASSDEDENNKEEEIEAIIPPKRNNEKSKVVVSGKPPGKIVNRTCDDSENSEFSTLPLPKTNPLLLLDDSSLSNLLLNRKVTLQKDQKPGGKVKITVPSVSDFNESEPSKKKTKMDVKGSGLFSILPPPKNNAESSKLFVPHSVSNSSQNKKILSAKANVINKYLKKTEHPVENADSDANDVSVGNSFFGSFLTDSNKEEETQKLSSAEDNIAKHNHFNETNPETNSTETFQYIPHSLAMDNSLNCIPTEVTFPEPIANTLEEEESIEANPLELDEKALQILCGNKKKRQQMPVNIIDLSGEEIMPDSQEWLLKQLSEEKTTRSLSHRKSQGPSTQSRRKHQITYLAYQAKAQELELQNQWANNRMSRRQTQSKYGF